MSEFSARILRWYEMHARSLPWRVPPTQTAVQHPDPYAVWVSEIMLQQTRVETVIPYFKRWLELFPTLPSLAEASQQNVLAAWEGLGYYSRARNLHEAARIVVTEYKGELPREVSQLRQLPGIGRYTAGAIASIAFNRDVPTLDGNLRRVFSRFFDVSQPLGSPAGEESLWALAREYLPSGRAGDYNQALMDLGAAICLPRKPSCGLCPLEELCRARALGVQEQRPVRKRRVPLPHRLKAAAVIVLDGHVLLNRRPARGLLGGMWEFPSAEVAADSPQELVAAIRAEYRLEPHPLARLGELKHAYTHFTLTESVYRCELVGRRDDLWGRPELKWVGFGELEEYPMGKVDRAIAELIL
jgi:A/G-specific adenine glycosylase